MLPTSSHHPAPRRSSHPVSRTPTNQRGLQQKRWTLTCWRRWPSGDLWPGTLETMQTTEKPVSILTFFSSSFSFLPTFSPPVFQKVYVSWRVGVRRSGCWQAGAADRTSPARGLFFPVLSWNSRDRDAAQWKLRDHKVWLWPAPGESRVTRPLSDPG